MSVAKISNVYVECIFEWFYSTICDSGGDGAAVICCENNIATSNEFIRWWKIKHKKDKFFHDIDEYFGINGEVIVNYHDDNENFMFCDKIIHLGHGDVSFIIEEDCKAGFGDFVIKKVKT